MTCWSTLLVTHGDKCVLGMCYLYFPEQHFVISSVSFAFLSHLISIAEAHSAIVFGMLNGATIVQGLETVAMHAEFPVFKRGLVKCFSTCQLCALLLHQDPRWLSSAFALTVLCLLCFVCCVCCSTCCFFLISSFFMIFFQLESFYFKFAFMCFLLS